MDDAIGHLRDFASHFFSRSQMQLDRFARVALEDASDTRIGLQGGLVLSDRTGADSRGNDHYKKKRVEFHNPVVLRDFCSIGQ